MGRKRTFRMEMPDVYVGDVRSQKRKNSSGEVIGERHFVRLEFIGGYVEVEIDAMLLDELPSAGQSVTAVIEMEPNMSGRHISTASGGDFAVVDTGFSNFRYVGFQPLKK